MIQKATASLFGIFLAVGLLLAQTKSHEPTPAEAAVQNYQRLVLSGALLTPEGWKEADSLFDHSSPYPKDSNIRVTDPGVTGEWPKGQEKSLGYREGVVVESKWGTFYGTIDPKLRYQAPKYGPDMPTDEIYHIVQVSDAWKIAGPLMVRSATLDGAMEYVKKGAEQSSDVVVKKNARKTLATLKRLKRGHGNACAC